MQAKAKNTRGEVLEIIKTMPGVTASEISQLMPETTPQAVQCMLSKLKDQGYVVVSGKKKESTSSKRGYPVSTFVLNPDYTPGSNVVQMKRKVPTEAGLKAQLDQAHKLVAELQAWKASAIVRYPDLAVPPIMLKARKLVAAEVRAGGDRHLADEIMAGHKDATLMVRVTLKALEEGRD
jgi:hypothetical protein